MHRACAAIAALLVACGSGRAAAPGPREPAPASEPATEPPEVIAVTAPPVAPAPAAPADARADPALLGAWIADGSVYTALYVEVSERDGMLALWIADGLPAHASGAELSSCEGPIGTPELACDGEAIGAEDGALRASIAIDGDRLALRLLGARWGELGPGEGARSLQPLDALERLFWVEHSDVVHEAGETGSDAPSDEEPAERIARAHAALATAGIPARTLDDAAANAVRELDEDLAARAELCARERCRCAARDLATALAPYRDVIAAIGLAALWSHPSDWDPFLRLSIRDGRVHGELVHVPATTLCEGPLEPRVGGTLAIACAGGASVELRRDRGELVITHRGQEARWRPATELSLVTMQRQQAIPEGPARARLSLARDVAFTLLQRRHLGSPTTASTAARALALGERALDEEPSCAPIAERACAAAALARLERRVRRDRETICSLIEE